VLTTDPADRYSHVAREDSPPTGSLPSSIVGFYDTFGGGIANFGNGTGSAFDALLSGVFNSFGVFISGVLGSGAINSTSTDSGGELKG
jgi:hypothetical protein